MADYLVHYGIKGQKWGKRRFQFDDGRLTPAGIARYLDVANRYSSPLATVRQNQKVRQKANSLSAKIRSGLASKTSSAMPGASRSSNSVIDRYTLKSNYTGPKGRQEKASKGSGGGGKGSKGKSGKAGKASAKEAQEAKDVWFHSKSSIKLSDLTKSTASLKSGFDYASYALRRLRARARMITKSDSKGK